MAVHEAAGDVLVQRVGEHGVADAWRRVRGGGSARPSPALVSSIATHSSPRGSTPAAANASSGTRVAVLPSAPSPSASARRRAGIDGEHEHPRRRVVALPRRPGRRRWWSCRRHRCRRRAPSPWRRAGCRAQRDVDAAPSPALGPRASPSSSSASASATSETTRRPDGPREQLGDVRSASADRSARQAPRGAGRGARRRLAARDLGDAGRLDHRRTAADRRPRRASARRGRRSQSRSNDLRARDRRTAPAALGWRPPRAASTPVSARSRPSEIDGLGDRHLLRRRDDDHAGRRRVVEDVEHPLGLVAHEADLDEFADHLRGADLADDVAARLGIDDHEVVVALAHLVAQLADGRGSPSRLVRRRRRSRTCDASGPMRPSERDAHEQPEVLAQRVLGVHRHREQMRIDCSVARTRNGQPCRTRRRARPWRPSRTRACACRGVAASCAERGRDGRLADASLAGDEQQVDDRAAPGRPGTGQPPKPMRRSPSGVPTSM